MDSELFKVQAQRHERPGVSSRLPGFYELPLAERRRVIARFAGLSKIETQAIGQFGALNSELADVFIENAVGTFALPLGIATNFRINGQDVLIPMAVEESSVLAAASHGAKLALSGGGFTTTSTDPIMTGQIQLHPRQRDGMKGPEAIAFLRSKESEIIAFAQKGFERLISRGGGTRSVSFRYVEPINSIIIYIDIDTRDAMGANIVNTVCENVSVFISSMINADIGLRILTNLCDKRVARASCLIKKEAFTCAEFDGSEVVRGIEQAYLFACHDVYRATTHNKGIMNGVDPVVIATGNDWRAVEAGAHAYACRTGVYQPLTQWTRTPEGDLAGAIELPMAVGTVGGVTKLHPSARASLKILGSPNARSLAEIICAVGLAQNLSALRALSSEGIQKGHMRLHQKNLDLLQDDPQVPH